MVVYIFIPLVSTVPHIRNAYDIIDPPFVFFVWLYIFGTFSSFNQSCKWRSKEIVKREPVFSLIVCKHNKKDCSCSSLSLSLSLFNFKLWYNLYIRWSTVQLMNKQFVLLQALLIYSFASGSADNEWNWPWDGLLKGYRLEGLACYLLSALFLAEREKRGEERDWSQKEWPESRLSTHSKEEPY